MRRRQVLGPRPTRRGTCRTTRETIVEGHASHLGEDACCRCSGPRSCACTSGLPGTGMIHGPNGPWDGLREELSTAEGKEELSTAEGKEELSTAEGKGDRGVRHARGGMCMLPGKEMSHRLRP